MSELFRNDKDQLCTWFGRFLVVQERKDRNSIYFVNDRKRNFLSHRDTWKNACKLAKMFDEVYNLGYADGSY